MEKRTLGRTGLKISVLGMGGLYVSSAGARGRDEACRAVHRALELGVNYVDTAPNYRDSEEVLGIALEGITQPYFLATKLGGRPQPFNPQDKDLLRQSVDESLRLLKRDYIDVLLVHEPDRPGQYDWWTDYDRFHGPVCDLLEELKAEKIIRFTGLGGTTAYQLPLIMATGNYDVVLTAFNYSLLWREATIAIFPEAERQNMGIIIGSPLQQGALARRYPEIATGAPWLSPPRQQQFQRLYAFRTLMPLPGPTGPGFGAPAPPRFAAALLCAQNAVVGWDQPSPALSVLRTRSKDGQTILRELPDPSGALSAWTESPKRCLILPILQLVGGARRRVRTGRRLRPRDCRALP